VTNEVRNSRGGLHKPEDYEEVQLGSELVQFVNVVWPDAPWGTLTPRVVRLAPNGGRNGR
jgi:hypothetical protein